MIKAIIAASTISASVAPALRVTTVDIDAIRALNSESNGDDQADCVSFSR